MATLVLSAAGAAMGSGFGGTVLGMSGAVIGRAIGATLGRAIDQRLLGAGSPAVEVGRVERFRLMSAGEGQPIARIWGRVRIGGHVIWASPFVENMARHGSGKGATGPVTEDYSYSVSLAVALCEGEILRVGRIWADGEEIDPRSLAWRLYPGSEEQLPDPKIEAVEGSGKAPSYRGLAYVVIEDLALARFGNRVPQFSFEVIRAAAGATGLQELVEAVALIPGTGEVSLATTRVTEIHGPGQGKVLNGNSVFGGSDLELSLEQLTGELPRCAAVSLVVSWFGNDLRCNACTLRPMVEQQIFEGDPLSWRSGGIGRGEAGMVPRAQGRPVYGGTPADAAVREGIAALRAAGQEIMFYPFVLMTQMTGNGLSDPYSEAADQAVFPWRGRITLSVAPGREGSPDRSAAADDEVLRFFGAASVSDFSTNSGEVHFAGDPQDWGYRRFILHYAHLCAAAGGVDAFCVGSELRGLTVIRGAADGFPAVAELRRLVAEVRDILGPGCRISYAADWSEYAGYTSPEGDRYFHLDPLWADPEVDFIGIDNYMPLSDWREGEGHLDAAWGSTYDLGYLTANVAGGEYFDWFYAGEEDALAQRRQPIEDGAYHEAWIWRQKDLAGWWQNPHHDRIGGERSEVPSDWVPGSKPFWFTEIGCAAIDRGTNQPNLFLDPKSSESFLPRASSGRRDDYIQLRYLQALRRYWAQPEHNPMAQAFLGRMVDLSHAFVWAWDARPFPQFPGRMDLWSDGENYARGHWISGRSANQPLAAVIAEICQAAGAPAVDVDKVHGVLRGYVLGDGGTARAALQPLLLAYGVEVAERDGILRFFMRGDLDRVVDLGPDDLARHPERALSQEISRAAAAERLGRLRLGYTEAEGDFVHRVEEASFPDEALAVVGESSLALVLTPGEARAISERWLAEARVAREAARFVLPPSKSWLGPGDVVQLGAAGRFRIDRAECDGLALVEAVRVEPAVYTPSDAAELRVIPKAFVHPGPLLPLFLDLPMLSEAQDPAAPFVAVNATPWAGAVAVWSADEDAGYALNRLILQPAAVGVTQSPLLAAAPGLWDRGPALRVRMMRGTLASASLLRVMNGANALAIGDGSPTHWEILQFAEALPVGQGEWELRLRLRGQAGSDALMPEVWPEGSFVVGLGPELIQLQHPVTRRGRAHHYRIGAAERGVTEPGARHLIQAFEGIGLRPLSPVHLRGMRAGGAAVFHWIRRTRLEGDDWLGREVPLDEVNEAYEVRILVGEEVRRRETVAGPSFSYSDALRVADGVSGAYSFDVAQLSERFGAGPRRRLDMAG